MEGSTDLLAAGAPQLLDPSALAPDAQDSLSVTPIVIVSDVALVRDCLRIILSRQAGIEVVGAASARCAFSDISMLAAKVALLDASIEDGPSLWHFVRERLPSTSLIVFDMAGGDARFLAWAEAGVMGYVGGDCSLPELVRAIRGALQGEKVVPSRLAGLLLGHVARLSDKRGAGSKSSALTAREREILDMIAEGMSNKSVALRLGVMESTVKNHVHNILEKMGVRSRGEAAAQLRCGRASLGS